MADISKIIVNNTLYNIKDANAVHTPLKTINGKTITGSGNIALNARARRIWYGTCSTSGSVQNKQVTTTTGDFSFTNGDMLVVRFTYTACSSTTSIWPDFLYVDGSQSGYGVTTYKDGDGTYFPWSAGELVTFVYYSSRFILVNGGHANTSYYGKVTLLPSYTSAYASTKDYYDGPSNYALYGLYNGLDNYVSEAELSSYDLNRNIEYFTYYQSASVSPKLYIYGKIVTLVGVVTPTVAITGSTTNYTICTIPEGYRPPRTIYRVMHGSTRNKWQLTVGSGGNVYFSRYRTIGSWVNASTGAWLPFQVTWLVD